MKKLLFSCLLLLSCICAQEATAQAVVFPSQKQAGVAVVQNKRNVFTLKNDLLQASFQRKGGTLRFDGCDALGLKPGSELFSLTLDDGTTCRASDMKLVSVGTEDLPAIVTAARGSDRVGGKAVKAVFRKDNLTVTWRAVLRNGSHYLRTETSLTSTTDQPMESLTPMVYTVDTSLPGTLPKVVGNTRGAVLLSDHLFAGLETPMGVNTVTTDSTTLSAPTEATIQGYWRRKTTLKAGQTWNVSSVVGLVADGQARRSFLAYSERERAVPWRAMPVYISWYELNIDRNNATAPAYDGNMTEAQCLDVVQHWYDDFYTKYYKAPKAFVWDDGWDEYGTWKFNPNFPEGFRNIDAKAKAMGSGIGAWLGPVGGYGQSGTYRRDIWKDKGGMQLSNDDYYRFFIRACTDMVDDYEFRFFKFDGISAQASAVGPDDNDTGYNNAEAIISIERAVREQRPDIFYNTTVGTWASPFWFHFTDAVWRQEGDYGEAGVGTDRERWITYRDRLVYQNFVQNSPVCPINTLMTHGFILSSHGDVSKCMDYDGIVRELRCAFACGSGMVELYNDYALMNSIADNQGNKGALWGNLSECMDWQERNAAVLPDIHWVGGNPWNGTEAEVYGWAAWNGKQCVLTLRNGSAEDKTLTTTLRKMLDIPSFVKTSVTLRSSFDDQLPLRGLPVGTMVDVDQPLSITVPAFSVYVSEGKDNRPTDFTPFATGSQQ